MSTEVTTESPNGVIEYTPIGESSPIKISRAIIEKHIVQPTKSGAMPSPQEIMAFMALCKARALNPFTKDAYLLGYDSTNGAKFSIITAKSALDKRADTHHDYDGYESGLVVMTPDGTAKEINSAICPKSEWPNVLGAWCKVYRKDRSRPVSHEVNRDVYDTRVSRWAADLPGMIIKCAEAGALRKAFPNEFAGLFVEEEMAAERATSGIVVEKPQQSAPKGIEDIPLTKAAQPRVAEKEAVSPSLLPSAVGTHQKLQQDAKPVTMDEHYQATAPQPETKPGKNKPATESATFSPEIETVIRLLEAHEVPRSKVLETLRVYGINVRSLAELTEANRMEIADDLETVVGTYNAEVA